MPSCSSTDWPRWIARSIVQSVGEKGIEQWASIDFPTQLGHSLRGTLGISITNLLALASYPWPGSTLVLYSSPERGLVPGAWKGALSLAEYRPACDWVRVQGAEGGRQSSKYCLALSHWAQASGEW